MPIINTLLRPFKKRFEESSSCRLVMTILTRDNEDVLQKNIEFHLSQGIDFFIVMDNLSTDGTRDILRAYEKLGVLHYIYQPSEAFNQAKWVTQMARMARSRFGATWVINNDSDEFWWPNQPNQSLKQLFLELPGNTNVLSCRRNNFIYPVDVDSTESFLETMIYKERQSSNAIDEPLPPKVAHRGSRIVKVGAGNHSVSGIGKQTVLDGDIEVLHFPFRSREQILDKIRIDGQALENGDLAENTYTTWRKMYQDLQATEDVDQFLAEFTYTQQQREKNIASGDLVEDTRLKEYLDSLKMRISC